MKARDARVTASRVGLSRSLIFRASADVARSLSVTLTL